LQSACHYLRQWLWSLCVRRDGLIVRRKADCFCAAFAHSLSLRVFSTVTSRSMMFRSLALLALAPAAHAMPASPKAFSPAQANGHPTACVMQVIGNPGYHYVICQAAPEGFYSTALNQEDGLIYYGVLKNGELVPGEYVVGEVNPDELDGIDLYQIESASMAHKKCLENDYCRWKIDNNGLSHGSPPDSLYDNLVIPF